MPPVELITAAHHHPSAGDVATSEVTAYQLSLRGIPVLPCERASGTRTAIIGGGHVLGNPVHGGQQYHLPGPHILNAAGILNPKVDYRYLQEYRLVTVRDAWAADILARQGVAADVVPCPATLIEPLVPEVWPPGSQLQRLAAQCQERVLIDANPAVFRTLPAGTDLLAMHTQAWLTWQFKLPCPALPPILMPRMLVTLIRGSRCVVTHSLHAAIFAVAVGTPLCVIAIGEQEQSRKLRNYFARAGFPEILWNGRTPPIEQALANRGAVLEMQTLERQRASAHLDRMAAICEESAAEPQDVIQQ